MVSSLGNCCLCGIFLTLLGLAAMCGWWFDIEWAVSVFPGAVPMQFNTALCFFLCGLGLILATIGRDAYATIPLFFAALIGFLTLVEYYSGHNIGIDELFHIHQYIYETPYPGRMAPNTALAFVFCYLSFLFLHNLYVFTISTGVVVSLGAFSVVGYVLDSSNLYKWSEGVTPMAVNTGTGFLVFGLSLLFCFLGRPRGVSGGVVDSALIS